MEPNSDDGGAATSHHAYPGLLLVLVLATIGTGWARPRPPFAPDAPLKLDAETAPGPLLGCLPMVGPSLLAKIEEARANGGIASPADLERIKGVGPRTVSLLRPFLAFPSDAAPIVGEDVTPASLISTK